MKYILLPIHPEWCRKILDRDKEIEVRSGTALYNAINRLIKEQGKAPCLIYCTKGEDILIAYEDHDYGSMNYYGTEYALITKPRLVKRPSGYDEDYSLYENERDAYNYYKNDFDKEQHEHERKLNGKVIAEFEASAELIIFGRTMGDDLGYFTDTLHDFELLKDSCLKKDDLRRYLKVNRNNGVSGTAIHIHNLKTFDEPKKLSEFNKADTPTYEQSKALVEMIRHPYTEKDYREDCERFGYALAKAPQSWCYAEAEE